MTTTLIVTGIIAALMVFFFVIAFVIVKIASSRQNKEQKFSLTNAGEDQSDFASSLAERYRNEN